MDKCRPGQQCRTAEKTQSWEEQKPDLLLCLVMLGQLVDNSNLNFLICKTGIRTVTSSSCCKDQMRTQAKFSAVLAVLAVVSFCSPVITTGWEECAFD
jgi:hypothetical protein